MTLNINTILVADDDLGITDMLSLWIASKAIFAGANVIIAKTPEEAVTLVMNKEPELVFLDLGLGNGISGLDVLKEIQASGQKKSKVLIFSGYTEHEQECLSAGAFAFVKKGTRLKDIENIIQDEFCKGIA